jgi:hypothetical protein
MQQDRAFLLLGLEFKCNVSMRMAAVSHTDSRHGCEQDTY